MSRREHDCTTDRETDHRHLPAALWALWEFRRDSTHHYCYPVIYTYDRFRDLAHRLTLRRFDNGC
jgi:hypothetical protein